MTNISDRTRLKNALKVENDQLFWIKVHFSSSDKPTSYTFCISKKDKELICYLLGKSNAPIEILVKTQNKQKKTIAYFHEFTNAPDFDSEIEYSYIHSVLISREYELLEKEEDFLLETHMSRLNKLKAKELLDSLVSKELDFK